jgi:hypothetical protein
MVFLLMEYVGNTGTDSQQAKGADTANQAESIMAEEVDRLLEEVRSIRQRGFFGEQANANAHAFADTGAGAAIGGDGSPRPRVGLILMGDEFHTFPLSAYEAFDLVLRHHYDAAHCEGTAASSIGAGGAQESTGEDEGKDTQPRSHVHWIPLGPSPGYLSMGSTSAAPLHGGSISTEKATGFESGSRGYRYFANFIGNTRSTICASAPEMPTGKRCYLMPKRGNAAAALRDLCSNTCSSRHSTDRARPSDCVDEGTRDTTNGTHARFCQHQHQHQQGMCSSHDRVLFMRSNTKYYGVPDHYDIIYSSVPEASARQADPIEVDPLPMSEFRDVLASSRFTVCAPGSSAESTRIYEALLAGTRVRKETGQLGQQQYAHLPRLSLPIVSADHHRTIPLGLASKTAVKAALRAHGRRERAGQQEGTSWEHDVNKLAKAMAELDAGESAADSDALLQAALSPFPLPTVGADDGQDGGASWLVGLRLLLRQYAIATDVELDALRERVRAWWRSCQHLLQLGVAALVGEQVQHWWRQRGLQQRREQFTREIIRSDMSGPKFDEKDEREFQQYRRENALKLAMTERRWHAYHWLRECHEHIGAKEYESAYESATAALEVMSMTPQVDQINGGGTRGGGGGGSTSSSSYGPQWREWDALFAVQALALQGVSLIKQVRSKVCW